MIKWVSDDCIFSMKVFHSLNSLSMASTLFNWIFSSSISPSQIGLMTFSLKTSSFCYMKTSVDAISLIGCISLVSSIFVSTSVIASIVLMLIFLLISMYSTKVWVDDALLKSTRGSILNCSINYLIPPIIFCMFH
jgi:hypothetical protein